MTTRSIRTRTVTGVTLKALGVLLALYFVDNAWMYREVEQDRTVRLKRELDDKQHMAARHDDYLVQLQEDRVVLSRLIQRLPSSLDLPTIEKAVHDQAMLAGIQVASVRLGKEAAKEFYADLPVDLVVQGSTEQLQKFVQALLSDSPLRNITAMTITPSDNPTVWRAAMSMRCYRYIEDDE
jgi:type IV pilus assembly protein PilO